MLATMHAAAATWGAHLTSMSMTSVSQAKIRGCPPRCGASASAMRCAAAARAPASVLTTCTSGGGSFLYVCSICSAEMPASKLVLALAIPLCMLLLLLLPPLLLCRSSACTVLARCCSAHAGAPC